MATNTQPIIFKITEAGKDAALQESGNGAQLKVNLTQIALGSGKYQPTGSEVSLASEVGSRFSIVSGGVEKNSNTLRFSASLKADSLIDVYEIGLMMDDGTLFAVAASDTDPLITLHANVTFAASFGISLAEIDADKITVTNDPNGAMALVIMENHLAAPDPHPQYLNQQRFLQFLQLAYPYGHKYWTHDKANPTPLFDAMFGFETYWRRLEGVGLVAVKDGDAFIGQSMLTLGQRGTTELATTARPHTYPVYTSYLFERYNPDDVVETVWNVTANKTAITEGEAVRFTVTANNLPDGQILDWSVKEGALSADSNDIDAPEKSESGTVILKNGQAVIDFVTTPDDNAEETQKHVRLTVGAPANLSINVPISDAGHNETVLHISQSTTDGVSLDDYYYAQYGAYPAVTDTVRFIVDEGVDIIAPNTDTPAVEDGVNWPLESQIVVENHGRILGRGGDAGLAATARQTLTSPAPTYEYITTPPTKGEDGGSAIKGTILVENYGLIAGGGGGGGGSGFFEYSGFGRGFSGGAGGGAPLGKRYPNPQSYEEYLEVFDAPSKYELPPLANPVSGLTYDNYNELVLQGSDLGSASYIRGEIFSGDPLKSDIIRISNHPHPISAAISRFHIPDYIDDSKTEYRLWSWSGSRGWVNGFRQSTNATIETKGLGGLILCAAVGGTSQLLELSRLAGLDISKNKGGDGGALGENGEASLLGEFYSQGESGNLEPFKVEKSDLKVILEPQQGGLAGYISQGNVTINNYGSGTTKGRTA